MLFAVFGISLIMITTAMDAVVRVNGSVDGHSIAEYITSYPLMSHVMLELGFAFLIASILGSTAEASTRREQARLFSELVDTTTKIVGHSVIEGIYGLRIDRAYTKAVIDNCLAVRHFRRDFDILYEISEFSLEELLSLDFDIDKILKVETSLQYYSVNASSEAGSFDGRYTIPLGPRGSNKISRVNYLQIGDRIYNQDEIDLLIIDHDNIECSSSEITYRFPIPAPVERPIPVYIRAVFIKERKDSEIFTFLLPTLGARARFHFDVRHLQVGVRARTASDVDHIIEKRLGGRLIEWEISGPVLPNNYVTVWWETTDATA